MRTHSGVVAHISVEELAPGVLGDLFRSGVKAAILSGEPRVARLWDELVRAPAERLQEDGETLPWDGNVLDLARNHNPGRHPREQLGDVLFFIPNELAYIARKIQIAKDPIDGSLQTTPASLSNDNRSFTLPQALREVAWELATRIVRSAFPAHHPPEQHAVALERLRYDDRLEDLYKNFSLLDDVRGKWSKLGGRFDSYKAAAASPMDARVLRGFFALACLTPGVNTIVQRLNERLRGVGKKNQLPPGARVLARPHADERFVTCLASSRGSIHTELFDGRRWVELPMTTDSLVILPGRCLAKRFGIQPTVHRVLHLERDDRSQQPQSGITLLLGAAPVRGTVAATNWTDKVIHNARRNGAQES